MSFNLIVERATQVLIDHVEELTALDQAIGDGDHGLNMRRGAQAIQRKKSELDVLALNDALKLMGRTCLSVIGGSSGPVFGVMLKTLGDHLPQNPNSADVAKALRLSIEALTRLGKAEVGQKTLLDVLDPVQKMLEQGGPDLVRRVKQCAFDSSLATANMDATRGRSSFLGERAKGHVDPGSRSVALIIGAICDCLA
jgi:phosphoenolpyruvate---glycerone phosphotransferase subunit DhaL